MDRPTAVAFNIGPNSKYIISTSGRFSSMQRYKKLLQDLLQLDIVYLPISSGDLANPKIDPQKFVWALRGLPCIGGAISRDIKQTVMPYLDIIDDLALSVQSVNTVIRKNDILIGYNTDALGFKIAIEWGLREYKIEAKSAVCYGYGGVSSVVISVLKGFGMKVYLTGRRTVEVARVAANYGIEIWDNQDVDLFVNAAPVTGEPLTNAVGFLDSLNKSKIAFDHEMPGIFLRDYCLNNGIHHISGEKMYVPQMHAQWSLLLEGLTDVSMLPQLLKEASVNI